MAVLALGLAAVHLLAGKLRFLGRIPRSRWLSFGGGVSVAYVFVHMLPELGEYQREVATTVGLIAGFVDHHVYLVALVGFGSFYGLERLAQRSRDGATVAGGETTANEPVFWVHIGAFALYNVLVGYLLIHGETPDLEGVLVFWVAMALHFVVNDYGLRHHHRGAYDRIGRWVLAAAVVGGWALGTVMRIDTLTIAVLIAFLGGGILLNVIKEELPEERESRFWAFAAGVVGYSVLLLAG